MVNGAFVKVTNYDETAPATLSAYGLAAGIHVQMHKGPSGITYFDNGIRTHGSFDYTSLRGRFSHGCHRLYKQPGGADVLVRAGAPARPGRWARWRSASAASSGGRARCSRCGGRAGASTTSSIHRCPSRRSRGASRASARSPFLGFLRKPGVKYSSDRPPSLSDSPESKAGGVEAP